MQSLSTTVLFFKGSWRPEPVGPVGGFITVGGENEAQGMNGKDEESWTDGRLEL